MTRNLTSLFLIGMLFIVSACSSVTSTDQSDTTATSSDAGDNKSDTGGDKAPEETAAKADLTEEKFSKIDLDMTYEKVNEIIGAKGVERSNRELRGKPHIGYEWNGEGSASVTAKFLDGKLQ